MRIRTYFLMAVAALVLAGICAYVVWPTILARTVAAHQESVTAELAKWGEEYSTIRDANEAGRAIEMLEYVQHYYVVAPGYRSDPATEVRLESQRTATIETILTALDQYVDEQDDRNAEAWRRQISKVLPETGRERVAPEE